MPWLSRVGRSWRRAGSREWAASARHTPCVRTRLTSCSCAGLRLRAVVALDVGATALGGIIADLSVKISVTARDGALAVDISPVFIGGGGGDQEQQFGFVRQSGCRKAGMAGQPTEGG